MDDYGPRLRLYVNRKRRFEQFQASSMKNVALMMASAAIFAGLMTAIPAKAYACYCEARSSYAWGWVSMDLAPARKALP